MFCSFVRYYCATNFKKTVFVSKSKCIFANLALEDWFYRNSNLKSQHVLLMWQSDPCVVIGRHQNPFVEANLEEIIIKGVVLSRRNSGGGTVYHDNGNLNLSFLTDRECYNRKYNLEIITRAVFNEYNIPIEINEREDLMINDAKVSGTAAKLGRPNAYHHCTLLVNVDKKNLSKSLKKNNALNIKTNATKSVRSKITNLSDFSPNINMENLTRAIAFEYMKTPAFRGNRPVFPNIPMGIRFVEPNECDFPGFDEIRANFSNWTWIYGKTPKFSVEFTSKLAGASEFSAVLTVENGLITDVNSAFDIDYSVLKNRVFELDSLRILKDIVEESCKRKFPLVM